MRLATIVVAALSVAGCQQQSGIKEVEPNTFKVDALRAPVLGGATAAKQVVLDEANMHCKSRGGEVIPVAQRAFSPLPSPYGDVAYELTFKCAERGAGAARADQDPPASVAILQATTATAPVVDPVPAGTADGKRLALVIGNGSYRQAGALANPPNDARLISQTLRGIGFEVIEVINADQATMKRSVQTFGLKLEQYGRSGIGLFYYAGHGIQAQGRNYLIPVTARIERETDLEIEAVSADWILAQMDYARTRLNLVVLDACRNNPFARSFRSVNRGLARMDAPSGTLIAYSTAPGDVATDGTGRNSPYSEALARAMMMRDTPVEQAFKQVRLTVREATSDQQTPWEASSLTAEFYFVQAARAAR
ncbi:MAG: caspase family protein [Proteobacteria bacterium]|nr:caspase family protein [Pseudomonadota bacterium]